MKRNVSLIITSRGWSENQWAMAVPDEQSSVVGATVQRASCGHCRIPEYVSSRPGMIDQRCAFCISCA